MSNVEVLLSIFEASLDMPNPVDLLQRALPLLTQPLHGRGMVPPNDLRSMGPRPRCLAMHRLDQQGWMAARRGIPDLSCATKFHALIREGHQRIEGELNCWERLSSAGQATIEYA